MNKEEERQKNSFVGESVSVELKTGFFLYGTVIDQINSGIWLETPEQTSFISFDAIFLIKKRCY